MNIAEILKNVPRGTKLYSPVFGEVTFMNVSSGFINVEDTVKVERAFYSNGNFYKDGECMLFPSRDNRDWDSFSICPFKKGDFIVREYPSGHKYIAIFSRFGSPYDYTTHYLCLLRADGSFKDKPSFGIGNIHEARLATEEEKKELLYAIERYGYKWNSDTLTLEKRTVYRFDINYLKPFDKVLVRDSGMSVWVCGIYSHLYNDNYGYRYVCTNRGHKQCIPYNDETKHLVGTTKDCPEYYKTW